MNQNDDTGNLEQALQSKMSINENQANNNNVRGRGNRGGYRVGSHRRGHGREYFDKSQENERYQLSSHDQGFQSRGRGRFQQQSDKSQVQCYNCNNYVHFSYE